MAYIRCAGDSGGSIQKKTATGAVATFNTGLPAPLIDVTSAIGYRSNGYTSASVINSKTTPVIDETPYQTRIAPSNIGNMALEKLVGVSCVFNQLVQNGNFESTSGWTAQNGTINGASNNELDVSYLGNGEYGQNVFCGLGFTPEESHVYFTTVDVKLPTTSGEIGLLGGSQSSLVETTATTDWQTLSAFFKGNTYSYFTIRNRTSNVALNNVKLRNAMLIDLTAMFGTEVADYLYTLESGTAGSGVALFKSLFGENYYTYTANTLMSCKPLAKVIKDSNDQIVATVNFSGNELRGLLKVGTNGLYADGDIDDGSGTGAVRYGIVDLGSLTYSYVSGVFVNYKSSGIDIGAKGRGIDFVGSPYSNSGTKQSGNMPDKSLQIFGASSNANLWIKDSGYNDATALKTALNGVCIVYELATPTTQTISAWTNPIQAKQGGTETFVDTRTIALPTGHDTIYGTDLSVKKAEFGTTVYGGSIDFTTGEVISNKNADGTDKTAEIISITPVPIMANFDANNLMSDTNGDTTVQYLDLRSNG